MRLFLGLALASLLFGACNSNSVPSNQVHINGNFPTSGSVAISKLTTAELVAIDTTDLDSSGNFSLSIEENESNFYLLGFNDGNSVMMLLSGGEDVNVEYNPEVPGGYTIEGSIGSEIVLQATAMHEQTIQKAAAIEGKYNELFEAAVEAQYDSLTTAFQSEFDPLLDSYREELKAFINKNIESPAIIIALYQRLGRIPMFNIHEDFKVFDDAATALNKIFPNSDFSTGLNEQVTLARPTSIGQTAPNFTLSNPLGEPVSLTSFKGNYVLVDFWASWCRPCRAENPNIVAQYNLYKDQGFQVLGVSLDGVPNQGDDVREQWLTAIQQDNLTWTHVSDLQGWATPLVSMYAFNGIPHSVLLDENGVIIAKNLRGEDLADKLAEIYAES